MASTKAHELRVYERRLSLFTLRSAYAVFGGEIVQFA